MAKKEKKIRSSRKLHDLQYALTLYAKYHGMMVGHQTSPKMKTYMINIGYKFSFCVCVSMLISKFKHDLFCLSTKIILNFMNNDVIHKTGSFY